MITAIDTNVLLDILIPDAAHAAQSKALLDVAFREGAQIISEAVYAEMAARFTTQNDLDEFMGRTGIELEPSQREALYAASQAWRTYTSARSQQLRCPACGHTQSLTCPSCGNPIGPRQHILADFLIGGHALNQADQLLTRDRGYYRTYFPALRLQE